MSPYNILIVEDDADINSLLEKLLTNAGYHVRPAFSGSEGKMCLEQYQYDLVLLDLMLPGAVSYTHLGACVLGHHNGFSGHI